MNKFLSNLRVVLVNTESILIDYCVEFKSVLALKKLLNPITIWHRKHLRMESISYSKQIHLFVWSK